MDALFPAGMPQSAARLMAMGNDDALLAAADDNYRTMWREIIRLSPQAVIKDEPPLLMAASGEPVPMFNPAFVFSHVVDPAALVERVTRHYADLGVPFSFHFRDERSPGLADACRAAGLVEHWQEPLMVLNADSAPVEAPPVGLTICPVAPDDVDDYVGVIAAGFGAPLDLVERVSKRPLLELPDFTGLLGRVDGVAVATSGLWPSEGVAGVYKVATVPAYRGRGYGAAMTWAAAKLGCQAGLTRSILQASAAGEPVYERMGYRTAARYRQFEGPAVS